MIETTQREPYELELSFEEPLETEPWRSVTHATGGHVKPLPFTRVQIASPSVTRIFGVLREAVRGQIQVLTSIPVPIRCPLEITLEGCRPAAGQAFYSIRRASVFLVGLALSNSLKPNCAAGSFATIRELDSPLTSRRGTILDLGTTTLSVVCKTPIALGAWVRIESRGWILLGVVKEVVPTSFAGYCVRVHLEAAFRVDSRPAKAIPETHILRSFPKLQPWTRLDCESPLRGDIL